MEPSSAPEMTLDRNSIQDETRAAQFVRLTSAMMILGTVRLVPALGDYASILLDASPSSITSLNFITRFFYENPLTMVLGSGWPLITAILLRRSMSRAVLLASAITFSILSVGGFLNLLSPIYFKTGNPVLMIGSFTCLRASLFQGNVTARDAPAGGCRSVDPGTDHGRLGLGSVPTIAHRANDKVGERG